VKRILSDQEEEQLEACQERDQILLHDEEEEEPIETMLVILLPDVKNSNEMEARAPESSLVLVFRLLKSASN
jgi:hypothetical protein